LSLVDEDILRMIRVTSKIDVSKLKLTDRSKELMGFYPLSVGEEK
jgi:hypothetical protein